MFLPGQDFKYEYYAKEFANKTFESVEEKKRRKKIPHTGDIKFLDQCG